MATLHFVAPPGDLWFQIIADEPRPIVTIPADGGALVFDWPAIEAAAANGAHVAVMLVAAREIGRQEARP